MGTNIVEYINNLSLVQINPYILFFLGQGKANIALFDGVNHKMTAHKEISRIIQCRTIKKLKYPKKSPQFISQKSLIPFYKETMIKCEKFWHYLVNKAQIDGIENINDANIGYMADDRIWRDFWTWHWRIAQKENECQDIMPFNQSKSNLIRIGDFSFAIAYPKKSDLIQCSFGLRDIHCFIDYNLLIKDEHFPKEISKFIASNDELCWDPFAKEQIIKKEQKNKKKQQIGQKRTNYQRI